MVSKMWKWTTGSFKRKKKTPQDLAGSAFADVAMAAVKEIRMKKRTQRIKAAKVQTKTASPFASPFMSPGGKRRRPGANEPKDKPSAETENVEANVPPGGTTSTGKRRRNPPHDVGLRAGKSSPVPDEHAIAAVDEGEGSASKRTKSAPAATSPQRELRRSLRRSVKGSLSPVPVLHSTEKALLDRAARAPAARERARMLKSRQPRAPLKDPLSSFGTPHGHLPPGTPRAALRHAMAARSPATRGGEGGLDARTQLSRRSVARHWLRIESETARAEACVEAERKGNVLRGFGDALVAPLAGLLGGEDDRALLQHAMASEMRAMTDFGLRWGGAARNKAPKF